MILLLVNAVARPCVFLLRSSSDGYVSVEAGVEMNDVRKDWISFFSP